MKKTTTGQATLRNMIVLKALEQQYPNKVSDKKVNSQFNKLKKQYGSSFDSTLEQKRLHRIKLQGSNSEQTHLHLKLPSRI
ncbi:hypothetical protein N577_000200 [Lacticaseibacillus rhamnosus 2166]|nr:hypothetical protein N577_000200 [Lacticaseibacillus rhamnosus 2166]